MNVYPLRLDEIVLVGKEQYKKLTRPVAEGGFDIPQLSNKYNTVLTNNTLSLSAMTFMKNNCLKRVVLEYNYTLCPSTDNSSAPETGKLTLTRVSIRGRNDIKIVPDYRFEYGYNPMYEKNHYDNWGMYNPNGTDNSFSHVAPDSDLYGTAWSLTKVITPLGGQISVAYERDVYSSVSGHTILTQTSSFSHPNTDYFYPTQLPIQHGCQFINRGAYQFL